MNAITNHTWRFSTIGGVKRVNLDTGADLLALASLDQKLWTALSCPTEGLVFDPQTLALMDGDKDGKIRAPEIIASVQWILSLLKNPDELLKQSDTLSLDALNDSEEAQYLLTCAKLILKNIGRPDAQSISTSDTQDPAAIFAHTAFNGDGIITVTSAPTQGLKDLVQTVINLLGGQVDRNGEAGISQVEIDTFYAALHGYQQWQQTAKDQAATILPFGDETPAAYAAFKAIEAKIDDYFLRCKLANYHQESSPLLNLIDERVAAITAHNLSAQLEAIAGFPLSKVETNASLSLLQNLNPAWENAMETFNQAVVQKLFTGSHSLQLQQWQQVKQHFAAYQNWLAAKEGALVEGLPQELVHFALLPDTKVQLEDLIAKDLALANEAAGMLQVDKLLRYHQHLYQLLKNFVTFFDFYSPEHQSIFQVGTLYIDQRSLDLCMYVNDMERHNAMAAASGMFLLYCDCVAKTGDETLSIVAALTNGDIDNIMEGRKALFYDREGKDYDATVVKIIENPISIRQAFWTPYRRVGKFIEAQVNKFAEDQDGKIEQASTAKVSEVAAQAEAHSETALAEAKPAAEKTPSAFDIGKFVGIFAAIGLAIGAIGGVLASFFSGFMALPYWKMPLALAGLILLISGPSMLIAWLKLRKRNLAPILDANGWAINARATVNISFGNTLTHLAELPPNASVNYNDPFKKKGSPFWLRFLIGMAIGVVLYFVLKHYGICF